MNVDERINVNRLLERAGRPKLEPFSKLPPVRFDDVRSGILRIVDEDYDSSMVDYVRDLTRTVIALADALEHVLDERDALLKIAHDFAGCSACTHQENSADTFPCRDCGILGKHWEWCGVEEGEDETSV